MKITDYTQVTTAGKNDIFLIDGDNGTKTITVQNVLNSIATVDPHCEWLSEVPSRVLAVAKPTTSSGLLMSTSDGTGRILAKNLIYDIIDMMATNTYSDDAPSNLGLKRSFYRGKNLGNTITSTQSQNIKNSTFNELFVGDYWLINGIHWRIADYFRYGTGDSQTSGVYVIPDTLLLTNQQMNTSDTVTGGYVSSAMNTTYIENAVTIAVGAFGEEHVNEFSFVACNGVSNGAEAGVTYVTNKRAAIPSEQEVFGSMINTYKRYGVDGWPQGGSNKTQLALFSLNPELIWRTPDGAAIGDWWLRDVASSKCFCSAWGTGRPGITNASGKAGVRPIFAIS